eukprot:12889390-Heterocapsa_arctica.AAC.1
MPSGRLLLASAAPPRPRSRGSAPGPQRRRAHGPQGAAGLTSRIHPKKMYVHQFFTTRSFARSNFLQHSEQVPGPVHAQE